MVVFTMSRPVELSNWSADLTEPLAQSSQGQGWPIAPCARRKGVSVNDLSDVFRHLLDRFGRPPDGGHTHAVDANVTQIDHRLRDVEAEQLEIEARLRRLETMGWRE